MKPSRRNFLTVAGLGALASAVIWPRGQSRAAERFEVTLTDAQWKAKLSPAAYRTLRHEDTERPGSSPLNKEKRTGT